jgi:cation/acetate symporter
MMFFAGRLKRLFFIYPGSFLALALALAWAERHGLSQRAIGFAFLLFSVLLYALIGLTARTHDVSEYYVAGRKVPALLNGMATAADWMSAASFIGLAGTLYLTGYQGLAFVMGWTGGYVLVALLLAPYLRRFGQFTIPDFLGARYGGILPRLGGVVAAVLASFVYLVAQIYGVGLVASRFVGLQFEIGVMVGLAGILVCSFLGGMRAVTWTQAMQYLILVVAYVTPVAILSYQVTGNPVAPIAYGQVVQRLGSIEPPIFADPNEQAVRTEFGRRAEALQARIDGLPGSLRAEREALGAEINRLKLADAPMRDIIEIERLRRDLPSTADEARSRWEAELRIARVRQAVPAPHAEAFPAKGEDARARSRINFLALVFCLMVGTAALPHILMRYYTTPSVGDARMSVFWSLLFILALYLVAPAYAVLAKYEIYEKLVGIAISDLPNWIHAWGKLGLVAIEDVNGDGRLQLAELSLNPDVIVLAMPEIAGLPYVVSGLVAAGAVAAALSTADGLLLTIAGSLSHDIYYRILRPKAAAHWRLVVSKSVLMVVAVLAAAVATQRPATILSLVSWAFSIAAASFFPAMVLGVFWRRANHAGAVAGMTAGLWATIYYLVRTEFDSLPWLGVYGIGMEPWLGIQSTAAGAWGVLIGFAVMIVVSLFTAPPAAASDKFVEELRRPL